MAIPTRQEQLEGTASCQAMSCGLFNHPYVEKASLGYLTDIQKRLYADVKGSTVLAKDFTWSQQGLLLQMET
jgi:hypothetical protein